MYRKATNTSRFIISESQHCYQHKMLALSFLANRLAKFPLTPVRYKKDQDIVDNIIRKAIIKIERSQVSTCQSINRTKVSGHPSISELLNVYYNKYLPII